MSGLPARQHVSRMALSVQRAVTEHYCEAAVTGINSKTGRGWCPTSTTSNDDYDFGLNDDYSSNININFFITLH